MTRVKRTISGDTPCAVHDTHDPLPYGTDLHHVWPKGMGGPDVKENLVPVCPTGHQNIHRLLSKLVKAEGKVTPEVLASFHPGEVKYATLGYERDVRGAL